MAPSIRISRKAALVFLRLTEEVGHPSEERFADELRAALKPKKAVVGARRVKRAKKATKGAQTKAIRAEVMARADGTCELCAEAVPTEMHHVFGKARVPQSVSNCMALCMWCHRSLTDNARGAVQSWGLVARVLKRLGYEAEAQRAWKQKEYCQGKAELSAGLAVAP